jgi:hypothetical protein
MTSPIAAAGYDTFYPDGLHVDPDALYNAGLQLQTIRDRLVDLQRIFSDGVAGLRSDLVSSEIPELHDAWLRAEGFARYPAAGMESQFDFVCGGLEATLELLFAALQEYGATDMAAAGRLNDVASR